MEKQAIKELMYGGINELLQNRRFYYQSSVGKNYDHWTDEGKSAITEFVNQISHLILDAEAVEFDRRAKQQTFQALKS